MERLQILVVLSVLYINGYVCMEIIGGNEAAPHSRPYMALLLGSNMQCGGALLKPNWILTAAHCIVDNKTYAILGAHNLKDTQEQQKLRIKRAITFPCFDSKLKSGDLQLLELEKPAKLNKFVGVIDLPKGEEKIAPGRICNVAGWGVTDIRNPVPSNVLREANLTIVENAKCQKLYKTKEKITDNMICAGPLKKRKDDTCKGDSGGPLICDKKYAGIVSFGPKKCGIAKQPGVYTRLAENYLKWIRTTIGGASEFYTI